jgi:hypothetical protein
MANHFFFSLHPSKAKFKPKGSATHYARNKGVMYLDADLARYIANCVALGEESPTLFVCGWLNRKENVMNVGFEIPRDEAVEQALELQAKERIRLDDFFHEE